MKNSVASSKMVVRIVYCAQFGLIDKIAGTQTGRRKL
uniref:Uncharacterized protein n=1 Tax=uncultured Desulfobacterium sp. TaxID=201089 RepID=E1YD34_9BACT|nr:unknown protein [uncultured Desulfobacterium sp.]